MNRAYLYLPFFTSTSYWILSYYVHVNSFLNGCYLLFFIFGLLFPFPYFSPDQVLDILKCIILIVWYMCLKEQQEVATELIQALLHMCEAGSFCPFGITHLLPICPAILGTVHRQELSFMIALKLFILYVYCTKFICRPGQLL